MLYLESREGVGGCPEAPRQEQSGGSREWNFRREGGHSARGSKGKEGRIFDRAFPSGSARATSVAWAASNSRTAIACRLGTRNLVYALGPFFTCLGSTRLGLAPPPPPGDRHLET